MARPKKVILRERRHNRVRQKISGTADRPRLVVFRSNLRTYGQLIDDQAGKILAAASVKKSEKDGPAKVGKSLADAAKKMKVSACVFDRNGYKYHGRVKAVAEGAREGGLKF